MNEQGRQGYISDETVRLRETREKLRRIRDSDHPASPWARNVIQIMDTLKDSPDDADMLRALGRAVAMFERAMLEMHPTEHPSGAFTIGFNHAHLTPDEIAAIFGLGTHQ